MISRTANRPRYRYAIVAIVKNERPYLAEWIAYHRLIGFEHFYIADHGSTDDSDLLLAKWQRQGLVTARRWEQEERAQVLWYQHVLEQHGHEATYMAFLDVDEFLVHPHCDRPLDWLEPTLAPEDVGGVAINWRIFGSSGMRFRQPGGVLERFTMASESERVVNCHVKSIVKPSRVLSMTAHTAELKPGSRYLGADGQAVTFLDGKTKSGRTERVIDTPMRVYHYNIKSQEEFVDTKMTRGRANMGPMHSRDLEYFHKHDMNEVRLGFSSELLSRVDDACRELAPELAAPPRKPCFFVHIPKTAGTSFRLGAKAHLGEAKVWHDYGETQRETAPMVVRWAYERRDLWRLWQIVSAQDVKLLGGHVKLEKYAHLAGMRHCFSFVRDPLQRLASEYHHFVRHHGYQDSFSAFYRRHDMINRQSRFLEATRLEALGFIGLTERYAESLAILNDLYGWQIPGMAENLGHASVDHVYEIDPADESALRALNAEDFQLYRDCERLFESRLALFRQGQPFVHGAIQQCVADKVVGWAWWATDDSPVEIEVWINDRKVGRTLANALRPGMLRWGAPRGAYVGFHLPIEAVHGDIVDCRVTLTQQSLGRHRVHRTAALQPVLES
ncbi:glycosyltransferase family 2 protein [Salinicola sp. CR57]|uniref:glycosyltransferase family 2 protein n=1 Tax=Salinicola sp. CR57 TaxID=1949086 RepID=UPI0018E58437|nr:glycosyltransferase family 2 protein [Salinicola sp. CR57]